MNQPKHILFLFSMLIVGLTALLPIKLSAQSWVADTLMVNFGKSAIGNTTFVVGHGTDHRSFFPEYLSVFEKKKALFFPVDQFVRLPLPLTEHLSNTFQPLAEGQITLIPHIHQFEVTLSAKGRNKEFTLVSSIELYRPTGYGDTILLGTIYHEHSFDQRKKLAVANGYEKVVDEWLQLFNNDLTILTQAQFNNSGDSLARFRSGKTLTNTNLYTSAELYYGTKFWGVDGELWLSRPEISKKFRRTTGIIRYQNHPDFHCIAIGKSANHWFYRTSNKFLFSNKTAFLIGINNWKDMYTADHRFEEMILFNLSATQLIQLNQLDQRGIVAGIGLMENLHYIIHHKPALKVALVANISLKL